MATKMTTITIKVPVGYEFYPTIMKSAGDVAIDPTRMTPQALLYVFEKGMQRGTNDTANQKGKDSPRVDRVKIANDVVANWYDDAWMPGVRDGIGEPAINRFIRAVLRPRMSDDSKADYKALGSQREKDAFVMVRYEGLADDVKAAVLEAAEAAAELDRQQKDAQKAGALGALKI